MKCPKCGSESVEFEGRRADDVKAKLGDVVAYYVNSCHYCGHTEKVKE